jgi:hypothetical protein
MSFTLQDTRTESPGYMTKKGGFRLWRVEERNDGIVDARANALLTEINNFPAPGLLLIECVTTAAFLTQRSSIASDLVLVATLEISGFKA